MNESTTQIIKTTSTWKNEKQLAFYEYILLTIPLFIRDVCSDKNTTSDTKVEAIKWLNEFTHRIQNCILEFKSSPNNFLIPTLIENIASYSNQNLTTNAALVGIIEFAFKKTKRLPTKTFDDYSIEYFVFKQALNEVCHGAYALPEWEFATLMGVTKPEVLKILNTENDIWKDKNVVAQRQYSIIDNNRIEMGSANLILYHPVKLSQGEWKCSYQITGIGDDKIYSICGVDSIQVIQLSYSIINGLLCNYNTANENQITWNDTPNDFGLIQI